ncbi:MAG TPA: hypothetical protein VKR41_08525 [Puia sp.]|nr:hypothetical protein [Puia sp.]
MEQAKIRALLEKYWQAETSVEEEKVLAEYFRQSEIPADLEPVRGVFAWREEEAELRPGADFDSRMLRRIGEMEGGGKVIPGVGGGRKGKVVPGFAVRFAAAAAVILCLGIGLLIPMVSPGPREGASPAVAENRRIITRDTYTDPNQALAAVRQASLVASLRINEGKHITQKNMTRLHDSWQAATGD